MKSTVNKTKRVRSAVIAVGFVLFFGVLSANDAKAQNIIGEVLTRMDNYNKALQSLQADIMMAKTDAGLGVTDITKGNTKYLPKSAATKNRLFMRIDWTKPLNESIVIIGDDYKLYRPNLNQVIVGKTSSVSKQNTPGSALGFLSMSKEQLKANYSVVLIGEEPISGGTNTFHLQLTPKVKTSYKLADLWVNKDGFPQQAKVTENNNDSTTIFLSNVQSNIKIQPSVFVLTYDAKKTKVIAG